VGNRAWQCAASCVGPPAVPGLLSLHSRLLHWTAGQPSQRCLLVCCLLASADDPSARCQLGNKVGSACVCVAVGPVCAVLLFCYLLPPARYHAAAPSCCCCCCCYCTALPARTSASSIPHCPVLCVLRSCPLQYGAKVHEWEPLLTTAALMGVAVEGVAFHVGSGATNPAAFSHAIELARRAWDLATAHGFDMKVSQPADPCVRLPACLPACRLPLSVLAWWHRHACHGAHSFLSRASCWGSCCRCAALSI
jgi:hypothetical protein